MDSIDLSRLTNAVNGFLSSVSQTGSDMGTTLSEATDKLSTRLSNQLSGIIGRSPPPASETSSCDRFLNWLSTHRRAVLAIALASAAAAGVVVVHQRHKHVGRNGKHNLAYAKQRRARRLARRAPNGGRSEVVLIAGSPHEPLVRLVAQDLSIRGFVVYITAIPAEEEAVYRENSEDIRPLPLTSYFDQGAIQDSMQHLNKILTTPVASFAGASPHFLSLAGVLLVPDLFYPTGPLEATPLSQWAQTVQSKLLMPLNILAGGGLDVVRQHSSRIVLLTPVIIGSLRPAFHAAESLVFGALSALALSLSRELASQHISFTHMKLGSFDTRQVKLPASNTSGGTAGSSSPSGGSSATDHATLTRRVESTMRADILSWPDHMRRLYAGQYTASAYLLTNQTRGSNLRTLYHEIYDVLVSPSPPRVVRVGRGSKIYEWLTNWAPESLVTLVMAANERS